MPISPAIGENAAEYVADVYRAAELRILARIMDALGQGLDAPDWDVEALARIQVLREQVLAELDAAGPLVAARIREVLAAAYGTGEAALFADVRGIIGALQGAPLEHAAGVAALATEATSALGSMAPGILRRTDDILRTVVAEATSSVVIGAETRAEAVQRILVRLAADSPDMLFVPTRSGRMSLPTYATMAVRTATARAAVQGQLDTMAANGLDLVIINPGPRACDICDRWARAVLARTGRPGTLWVENLGGPGQVQVKVADTLDAARRAGWGHPNCRCSVGAYLPGITDPSVIRRPRWDQSAYEAQQRQRTIERTIRKWKERLAVSLPGTPTEAEARREVARWQGVMRDHLDRHPELKRQSWREQLGSNL